MKVLFYGESPSIATGLSQLARRHIEVFRSFGWEIETCCINHYAGGSYPSEPYKTNPTQGDGMNRENMSNLIRKGDYDILFFSCDCCNIQHFFNDILYAKCHFPGIKIISYTPMDCDEIQYDVFAFFPFCDAICTYSNHSKKAIERTVPGYKVCVIYLGCDPDFFHPVGTDKKKELKQKYFKTDKYVVINCNRNQWRKDIVRSMYAFHLFHEKYQNTMLYLHMKKKDVGGDIMYIAEGLGMKHGTEVMYTGDDFDESQGSCRETLREIYQASDLFLSTSTGEGWGLTVTDAMSSGLPVLVPSNTAFLDLVGVDAERGTYIDCGGVDNWVVPYGYGLNRRDICSTKSAVEQLTYCHNHQHEIMQKAQVARSWAEFHTWERHKELWATLLREMFYDH